MSAACGDGAVRGRLIVLEGLDGSGKTSASWALAQALQARWLTTPGEELRSVRERFEAAFAASREARSLAHGAAVVEAGARAREWCAQGVDVVVDRYWLSTLVYAPDAAWPALAAMEPLVAVPDLTLFLAAPRRARQQRMAPRGLTVHDRRTLDPVEDQRLHRRYRDLGRHPLAGRWVEIDANDGPDRVLQRILGAVSADRAPRQLALSLA